MAVFEDKKSSTEIINNDTIIQSHLLYPHGTCFSSPYLLSVCQVTVGLRVMSVEVAEHVIGYLALSDSPPLRWFSGEDDDDAHSRMFDWVAWIHGAFKNTDSITAVNSLFLRCLAFQWVSFFFLLT